MHPWPPIPVFASASGRWIILKEPRPQPRLPGLYTDFLRPWAAPARLRAKCAACSVWRFSFWHTHANRH